MEAFVDTPSGKVEEGERGREKGGRTRTFFAYTYSLIKVIKLRQRGSTLLFLLCFLRFLFLSLSLARALCLVDVKDKIKIRLSTLRANERYGNKGKKSGEKRKKEEASLRATFFLIVIAILATISRLVIYLFAHVLHGSSDQIE